MGLGGFSWKRATGITKAKTRLSKTIGVPLTKSGRQRKIGGMISKGGCLTTALTALVLALAALAAAAQIGRK